MKTAIELRAARLGSDAPREGFVTDLHRRLASEMAEGQTPATHPRWAPRGTRRQVVIGTSVAAASAAAGVVVGRNLLAPTETPRATPPTQGELDRTRGHGGPSARVSTFLTVGPSRSTWGQSTGSFRAPTQSWRRCPVCARIRDVRRPPCNPNGASRSRQWARRWRSRRVYQSTAFSPRGQSGTDGYPGPSPPPLRLACSR
jgi:hypothetical protein